MATPEVTLTIEGEPGAGVQVTHRNHRDAPLEPVYTGELGPDGRVTIAVPRASYVLLSGGCKTESVDLSTGPAARTVRLRKTPA
jgi:hypothetical protein